MRSRSNSLRPQRDATQSSMNETAHHDGQDDGMQVMPVDMDGSDDIVADESRGPGDVDKEAEEAPRSWPAYTGDG